MSAGCAVQMESIVRTLVASALHLRMAGAVGKAAACGDRSVMAKVCSVTRSVHGDGVAHITTSAL
jgi:hypothetical protein